MDYSNALEIVGRLADGIDPLSGRELPSDAPYQQPQILRALFLALRALELAEPRAKRQSALPEQSGKPWSDEEDLRLIEGFGADRSVRQLALSHRRTPGAIQARLLKLGVVPNVGAALGLRAS